jgi:hypothetical protein
MQAHKSLIVSQLQKLLEFPRTFLEDVDRFSELMPCDSAFGYQRLTLEITNYCVVGCLHCRYSTPLPPKSGQKAPQNYLSQEALHQCAEFTHRQAIPSLYITGGGEPTHEWENVLFLIENSYSSDIVLATAAQWATTEREIHAALNDLLSAIQRRKTFCRLTLRISVDDYHSKSVPIQQIVSLIKVVKSLHEHDGDFPIQIKLRSLLSDDSSVKNVADLLSGKLISQSADCEILELSDGYQIEVIRKSLVFIGRLKQPKNLLSKNYVRFSEGADIARQSYDPLWPAMYAGGLNLGIRPNGEVYLYGTNPRFFGTIYERKLEEIVHSICRDIICRACLRGGYINIWQIAKDYDEMLSDLPDYLNDLGQLVPKSLSSCNVRLYVTLQLLKENVDKGFVSSELVRSFLEDLGLSLPDCSMTEILEEALNILRLQRIK